MNYREILDFEDKNRTKIYLHVEGKFFRAYNQSAFLFWDRIQRFRLTRRFVKTVNAHMIYLGFPMDSAGKWLREYELKRLDEKLYLVEPGGDPIDDASYLQFEEAARLETQAKDRYTVHTSVIEKQPVFELARTIAVECLKWGRHVPKTDLVPYGNEMKVLSYAILKRVKGFYDAADRGDEALKIQALIKEFQLAIQILADPEVRGISENAAAKVMEESSNLFGQIGVLGKTSAKKKETVRHEAAPEDAEQIKEEKIE